jgi:AAA+ superfamily predicted ATPase
MDWRGFNNQYLNREIVLLQLKLRNFLSSPDAAESIPQPPEIDKPKDFLAPTLEILCKKFGLSEIEREILIMCVAAEISFSAGKLLGQAIGNDEYPLPTINLALSLSAEGEVGAFNRNSPLFTKQIVNIISSGVLITAPLKIQPWALQYILGYDYNPPEYLGALTPEKVESPLESIPESYGDRASELLSLWTEDAYTANRIVQLCGPDPLANQHIADMVCRHLGLGLYTIDLDAFPRLDQTGFNNWLLWWHRRALLQRHVLFINCTDTLTPDRTMSLVKDLKNVISTYLIFSGSDRIPEVSAPTIDIKPLSNIEQKAIWQDLLSETKTETPIETLIKPISPLVSHFNLNAAAIHTICGRVTARIEAQNLSEPEEINDLLWHYCRTESRSNLEGLVERIEPKTTWDELVLDDEATQVLHQIIKTARNRNLVYSDWRMGGNSQRGMGITALFYGPPGTGKTTAAEIIARELGLDLYRVDLSQVSDKYIGETEKKLKKIFDEAEKSGAQLVFDEADSLIGKRSDVKDSKDRYANQTISYLLQRMEAYTGLAILTTNLPNAIDSAFLRRIRFKVRFEYPTVEQRFEIWKRMFPQETPIEGLSFQRLAQLNVSGAIIRNIALGSAFLAAEDEPRVIRMNHLLAAARMECIKQGRPITDEEIRGWV